MSETGEPPGVPPLVHRIWLDEVMPAPFVAFGERWRALHPGWEVRDWTDSDTLPSLRNGDLFRRAREIWPGDWQRFQADLLRLELLYRFGGLYVDTDTEPRRHIGPLITDAFVAGRSPQHIGGHHPVTNAVMASAPGHPFVAACIAAVPHSVERYRGRALARAVGPWLLTRVYESRRWEGVTILDPDTLYGGGWLTHYWNTGARRRGGGVR